MRVTTRSAKATIQTGDTDVVSLLCSARSALRLVTPISPHPARARLAFSHRHGERVGGEDTASNPVESVWRARCLWQIPYCRA